MNEYGELIVNLYLLEDVYLKDVNDKVSKFFNYIMGNSQYLSEIHKAKCVYKGIKLLGYKYNIYFKENSFAQEMANFITVTGLLEKNSSLECGFVKAYYK